MMKILVITSFADLNPDYSLATVVADQLTMLAKYGYSTGFVALEIFRDEGKVPEGVTVHRVMPVLRLKNYQPGDAMEPDFPQMVDRIAASLRPLLADVDIVITHDLVFLGYYLPHNQAIRDLAAEFPEIRWLHWIHSAPAARPAEIEYPHTLRFSMPPNAKIVYLNDYDTQRVAEMFGTALANVRVVHNPRDPAAYFEVHPMVDQIMREYALLEADVVAVFPFSTPRWAAKNVKRLIWLMAKIKAQDRKVLLVMVNAHCNTPAAREAVGQMLEYGREKGLTDRDICFTSNLGTQWETGVPNAAVRQLFQLSNVFINPSYSECCSLILLEAALCKNLLVLNRDVPSMREFGGERALYPQFTGVYSRPAHTDEDAYWDGWAKIILATLAQERALDSFRHVLVRHSPDWIFRRQMEPLFFEI